MDTEGVNEPKKLDRDIETQDVDMIALLVQLAKQQDKRLRALEERAGHLELAANVGAVVVHALVAACVAYLLISMW